MNRRIRSIRIVGLFAATVIAGRLVHLSVFQGARYAEKAFREHYRVVKTVPRREAIYDSRHRLLAASIACDSIFADPKLVTHPVDCAKVLAEILGGDASEYLTDLQRSNRRFVWVKRQLTPRQSSLLLTHRPDGIFFRKEMRRFYVHGEEFGPVLGFTGIDGYGLEGIERFMEPRLSGRAGMELQARDALARPYMPKPIVIRERELGQPVVLTIDSTIQFFAMNALAEMVEKEDAEWGALVAICPETGEVLAMANLPTFDANRYAASDPSHRRNRCIAESIEPGSAFKPITFAAALDRDASIQEKSFDCQGGQIRVGSAVYQDWKEFGRLTFEDILVFSSNVGTIRIAQETGSDAILETARRVGFGTGFHRISGAAPGHLRTGGPQMDPITAASLSIGYGLSATPMQIARAYAMIAADGRRVVPRLVNPASDTSPDQVIQRSVASTITRILTSAVQHGTGKEARPAHYTAAGKTGTARYYDTDRGGYDSRRVTCLFAGFAPAENPRIAVCVVISDPQHHKWGSHVAAPVFAEFADRTLRYLGVVPSQGERV